MRAVGLRARPRAVRPRQRGRRCDGYAGASRQPGGRYHPAPGGAGCSLPGSPVGLPETLLGSRGRLAAPASAISVPEQSFGFPAAPSCRAPRSHLEPLGRSPAPRHCWRFDRKRLPSGPPGSRAIPLSFRAPPAATRTVNGPTHVPSQTTVRAGCHTRQAAGISPAHRRCTHGESRPPSPTRPSSPKPRPCASFPPSGAPSGNPDPSAIRASGFPLTRCARSRE